MSVAEGLDVGLVILNVVLQAHNLDNVLDLLVAFDLRILGVTNIERLTLEGEDTVVISADNGQARHGKGLRGVTLGKNESTVLRLGTSGKVGIIELGNAGYLGLLRPPGPFEGLPFLELGHCQNVLHDIALLNLLHEFRTWFTGRSKAILATLSSSEILLGLRIEGRIDN